MQRIVPSLWFNHNADEAVEFYRRVFEDVEVVDTQNYPTENLPDFQKDFAGQTLAKEFTICGYRFVAVNAGDEFHPDPSISFFLNFAPSVDPDARERLDRIHAGLLEGGGIELMPLGEYPFSPHYAWVQDCYGVSWQLILTNPEGDPRPFIVPSLMFGNGVQGRAREAFDFYAGLFDGTVGTVAPYPPDTPQAGEVMFADFNLLGQWFAAMDSADQDFTFTCGVSLILECDNQEEIDRFWSELSRVPEAEACGWCADQFGVSWQIVPYNVTSLTTSSASYALLLEMKKIDVAALEAACEL